MRRFFVAAAALSLAALGGCASVDNAPRASSAEAPESVGIGPHGKKLYYFMVFSNATPGQDDEFNRWYDRIHTPVMIERGDFVWGQRFRLSADQFVPERSDTGAPSARRQYLVIFAVETNDIKKVIADANRRLALPRNVPSKAMAYGTLQGLTYEALGPRTTQKQAQRMLAEETAAGRVPSPDVPAPPGSRFGRGVPVDGSAPQTSPPLQ